MATSPNLEITHIEQSQSQKEVTMNEAIDVLDAALSQITITLIGGSPVNQTPYTLREDTTPQEWQYGILNFVGSPGLNKDIIFPLNKKAYIVFNGSDVTIRCTVAGSPTPAGVEIAAGGSSIVRCDGTEILEVSAGGGGSDYDLSVFFPEGPGSLELVLRHDFVRAVTFPQNLEGSFGSCETAATNNVLLDIQKNGASVGSVRFNGGSPTDRDADFVFASDVTFAAGDVMKIVAPVAPDATLADFSFTLKGSK